MQKCRPQAALFADEPREAEAEAAPGTEEFAQTGNPSMRAVPQ
jgi:hypothetical protein